MKLWTVNIEALGGFYASDAYVVAADREDAIVTVIQAVTAWVQQEIEEKYFVHPVGMCPSDIGFAKAMAGFFTKVHAEVAEKLVEVEAGYIVDVRT